MTDPKYLMLNLKVLTLEALNALKKLLIRARNGFSRMQSEWHHLTNAINDVETEQNFKRLEAKLRAQKTFRTGSNPNLGGPNDNSDPEAKT